MRFLGGGVGHAEQAPTFCIPDTPDLSFAQEAECDLLPPAADGEDESDEEDPDHGYAASDAEEDAERGGDAGGDEGEWEEVRSGDEGEPDLGPEDGEGDDIVDEYEQTRYAPF